MSETDIFLQALVGNDDQAERIAAYVLQTETRASERAFLLRTIYNTNRDRLSDSYLVFYARIAKTQAWKDGFQGMPVQHLIRMVGPRVQEALRQMDCGTLEELITLHCATDFIRQRGFGRLSLLELRAKMQELGYTLRDPT